MNANWERDCELDQCERVPPTITRTGTFSRLYATASVLCGDRLLDEFDRALHCRYFTQRLTPEEREVIVELVALTVVMLPDPHTPPPVLRDPDDDYIVALARAANADAIVTGDKDLLDHAGLEPPAITPRTACERFGWPSSTASAAA